MNILNIVNIVPSSGPGVLSYIEVALDYTNIFHGNEWISETGVRTPWYSPASGLSMLPATTLEIVDNTRYNGHYTVYTPTSASDPNVSVEYVGGNTRIYLRDTLPAGTGAELSTGKLQNISTYLLPIAGEPSKVVLERQIYSDRPITLFGRDSIMWGEGIQNDLIRTAQNFAGPTAPANPLQGQLWFHTTSSTMFVWTGAPSNSWTVVNQHLLSQRYRHTQTVSATTWTVQHNLNILPPYYTEHSFYVNTPGGVKPVSPADVTYVNGNRFDVTFNTPESGFVIVRN